MPTQIKITQLTDIGSANLAVTTLLPVVNMAGVPTTQKTTLGNLANVILSQSGGNYAPVATANIAYSVANAAQPNITSVGTLTNVAVSGNATINGNITSNGTAYVGNLSTTGLASITTLAVGSSANLGAIANVRITGGTAGQVLSTDGAGNLSWASDSGGNYGNSNVATFLASYGSNTITTTGNVSVGNIIGNGQALTNIAGANVSGFVPNANVANTAYAVAAANVSGLGNIATRNLDGNASNVLHGDGTWSADTTTYGNSNVVTLLSAFGSNTITTTGNVSVGNISTNGTLTIGNATITEINPIVLGFTDDIYVAGDVLSTRLKSNSSYVALSAENGNGTSEWTFSDNGVLTLPQPPANSNSSTSINSVYSNTVSFIDFVSNNSANFTFGTTANHNIVLITGLNENDNRWVLGYDGNLTLPGNTFAVNYANGAQVALGGSGNTGNVTFDDVTVQGVNGLNLSAGADFTANLAYLQVRAGDVASHIHLDTGNNEAYDLIVGDDQNYVQVSSTGNILLSSYDSNTAQYTWTLDYNGNLILAGGNSVIQSIANSSLDPLNPNVSTMVLTPDPGYGSQALVLDPTAPGHIHLRAPGANIDEPSANIFLGGEESSFEVGYYNGAAPNLFVHSGNNTWTFDNSGNLTLPGSLIATSASPAPTINGFSITNSVGISGNGNISGGNISATGNVSGNFFLGNGSQLTGITVTSLVNGTSNVVVASSGNVTVGVAGTANVITATSTGANVTGTLNATGDVTAQGTGSNIVRRAFGLVAYDTAVTLDDLTVTVSSSTSQLTLSTSGSWQGTGWTETFAGGGTPAVTNWVNLPLNPGYNNASGAMNNQGNGCRCIISDQTPSAKVYQITVVRSGTTGSQWNISIERLV